MDSSECDVEMDEVDPFAESMPIPEESQILFEQGMEKSNSDSSAQALEVGGNRFCGSPDIFGPDWDDIETQSQQCFEQGMVKSDNASYPSSPDIFGPDWDDDTTQSQQCFERRMVESDNASSSPELFGEYLQDENRENHNLMANPAASAPVCENEEPIHLITKLKERGVSEQHINTLCESGFATVESYIFASTNDRYEVPGLDETSKIEIETEAKAIVPNFGFKQATQIHRGCDSPDIFTGEFPDDQLPSTSATSEPVRRVHLISILQMPSPEIQQTLVTNGYVSVESLLRETFREVMESTKLSKDIVDQLQNAAREIVPDFGYTQTMQLYRRKTETVFITTGCAGIDTLLGGGVRSGSITQIFGESGSGKTQISHMLAVTVQLPTNKGGADAKCIYLDSRNSFRTERLIGIANALNLNPTSVLDNIAYAHVKTTGQQSVLLHQASSLLCSGSYALLIVDDVISVFKEEYGNASEIAARQIELTKFLKSLANIAKKYGISVVFLNQIVSQLNPNKPQFGLNLPAGGRCVALASDTRPSLTKGNGGSRVAAIYDPDHQNAETATFFITANGLADVQ